MGQSVVLQVVLVLKVSTHKKRPLGGVKWLLSCVGFSLRQRFLENLRQFNTGNV